MTQRWALQCDACGAPGQAIHWPRKIAGVIARSRSTRLLFGEREFSATGERTGESATAEAVQSRAGRPSPRHTPCLGPRARKAVCGRAGTAAHVHWAEDTGPHPETLHTRSQAGDGDSPFQRHSGLGSHWKNEPSLRLSPPPFWGASPQVAGQEAEGLGACAGCDRSGPCRAAGCAVSEAEARRERKAVTPRQGARRLCPRPSCFCSAEAAFEMPR